MPAVLKTIVENMTFDRMGLSRGTPLGEAVNFFIYDSVKIVLLLTVIVFVIAVIRSYFSPERTRARSRCAFDRSARSDCSVNTG